MFIVSVPVLSVHITEVEPRVSTAGSFLIMEFFFDIVLVPIESTIVTIEDRASGIAATAMATAKIKEFKITTFRSPELGWVIALITSTRNMNKHITKIVTPSFLENFSIFDCKGVCLTSVLSSISAILPISVSIPVLVQTNLALPFTTIDVE